MKMGILSVGSLILLAHPGSAADVIILDPIIDPERPPAELRIEKVQGHLRVSWTGEGVLQSSRSLRGRWSPVVRNSPYGVVSSLRTPWMYYRVSAHYNRPATVRLPAGYDPSGEYPLVVGLHGYSVDVSTLDTRLPLEPLADEYGFLYVKPLGARDSTGRAFWNATDACCAYEDGSVDDSAYLRRLIDFAKEVCAVDERRIYIAGYSNGGFMAHRLACDHADTISAIVSYAGTTFLDMTAHAPSEPVSVLQIHGTEDVRIQYEGGTFDTWGGPYPGALDTVQSWGAMIECGVLELVPDGSFDLVSRIAGKETHPSNFAGCPPGTAADLWTIEGGGHWETLHARRIIEWLYAHPKP